MSKVSMVPVSTWKTYSMVFDGVSSRGYTLLNRSVRSLGLIVVDNVESDPR
jgi:hypothetical protein